jgi:two-component system sensor histidine kinase AlgZ
MSADERMRRQANAAPQPLLLPDLCSGTAVAAITLCAAALAVSLAQLPPLDPSLPLRYIRPFLFLLWVGLGSAALLCALRSVLSRGNYALALLVTCCIPLLMVLAVSVAALRLSALPQLARAQQFRITSAPLPFLLRNLAVAAAAIALLVPYFWVERRARTRADRQARLDLAAWQLPLQPLFLRQTLDALAAGVAGEPARTLKSMQELAAWLDASLAEEPALIPLRQEIEHAQSFIRLAQLRLGERLHVVWDLGDAPGSLELPHPVLSPLLAFAIEQGIEPRAAGGTIIIRGAFDEGCLSLSIYHPLPEAGSEQPLRAAVEQLRESLQAGRGESVALQAERRADEWLLQLHLRGLSVPVPAATTALAHDTTAVPAQPAASRPE